MPKLIKKILLVYISIVLTFAPFSVFAASPAGWAFNSFNVATSVVTAMKNGGTAAVTVAKSPISQKIAKGIVGGAIVGAAIPLAISQLTGIALSAVDWLLDPANNQIRYKNKDGAYLWYRDADLGYFSTQDALCRAIAAKKGQTLVSVGMKNGYYACFTKRADGSDDWWAVERKAATNNYQTIPIPTVADKIYDNAKTDSNSRSVVNDAVRDYVNEGTADTALDNAKADADASHACGSGTHWSGTACVADTPSTPSTPTTPDTPFDPTSILDAIGRLFDAVMSIPDVINTAIDKVLDAIASITDVINTAIDDLLFDIKDFFQPIIDKFTDFVDWVKTEPTPTEAEPVDIQTPDIPQMESTDITFGGQCPQNFDIDIDLFGKPVKFTLFDSSPYYQKTVL